MRTFVCRGQVELQRAADVVRGLAPDKPWRIELVPHRNKRSSEQNARLWAIYGEIAKGTGHTCDEIHEAMKAKFLPPQWIRVGDEEVKVIASSTKLDVKEFSEFMEQVEAFAASELGVVVARD